MAEMAGHKAAAAPSTTLALTVDGRPLGEDGQFKLVGSEEQNRARWVRNLEALAFVTVE